MPSRHSFIYDYVRTPFGKYGKALAGIRPDDLAARTLEALLSRWDSFDLERIDDVILGDANQAGEDNRNVARMAALLAGLPVSVPGVTVNRLCGSSMEAAIQASRAILAGDAATIVAGGVESMSRAPWVTLKTERPFPAGDQTMHSTALGWRMVNPRMPEQWAVSLGETAEILADRFDISREEQDQFALSSHRKAAAAWDHGVYDGETISIHPELTRDEAIRADSTLNSLGALSPAFRDGGSVTAGNSSPLSDGSAMLLIGDESFPGEPRARISARAAAANEPHLFGIAPAVALERAVAAAGRRMEDIDLVEINEAFAAQTLACMRLWPQIDPQIININGGAIAIGHPLGASGARLIGHLANQLEARDLKVGVATLCIGVGQALAVVLER